MKINNIDQGRIKDLSGDRNVQSEEKAVRRGKSKVGRKAASGVSSLGRLVSKARVRAEAIGHVRGERIAEVQQRIEDGYYDTDEVREQVVRKLADRLKRLMRL